MREGRASNWLTFEVVWHIAPLFLRISYWSGETPLRILSLDSGEDHGDGFPNTRGNEHGEFDNFSL